MDIESNLNKRLKGLLGSRSAVLVPGAFNALAARIAEDVGFEAIYVTGAGVSNGYLGAPDIGLLTVTELAQNVVAIRDAVSLPLIVDADTGFGNAINVARTVRLLERSGANAIQIEDQEFPKKCGHFSGKSVISAGEMAMKVRAAADARSNADFQIIARTDAIACNGLEDALERSMLYIEAGADVTFVEAPETLEDMDRIAKALPVPQVVNLVAGGGMTPMADLDTLNRMGFAMVLYANAALQAAMHAMQRVLRNLHRTGSLDEVSDLLVGFTERQRLVSKPKYDAHERRYAVAAQTDSSPR